MKSDIVVQLRMNSECLAPSIMLAAADEIERLREERDQARREICWMLEHATNDPKEEHAKFWGWTCFKEDGK